MRRRADTGDAATRRRGARGGTGHGRGLTERPVTRRLVALFALILWTGFVLYPNPRPLIVSIGRLFHPPVDPAAVTELAAALPDSQAAVEAYVEERVPYRTAWELYGQVWYFPTVTETLARNGGDCQAEAILTASILQAKGLPYTLHYSFDHVWVDYPGKTEGGIEDPATAIASTSGAGWLRGLPQRFPLSDIVRARLQYHWDPMPSSRKVFLILGLVAAVLLGEWPRARRLFGHLGDGVKRAVRAMRAWYTAGRATGGR